MLVTVIFLFILVFIVVLLVVVSLMLTVKLSHDREKYSTFECGFDGLSALRLPFSLNFYFITIIFLIFDVELVLVLPFIFNLKILPSLASILVLTIFFVILVIGFFFEWVGGLLNWLI